MDTIPSAKYEEVLARPADRRHTGLSIIGRDIEVNEDAIRFELKFGRYVRKRWKRYRW